ncbi:MAG: thermopsin family protease, partial [Thermoproteus sp.]|nr:thermopsin family protease [Thermoproteus sp.]
MAALIALALATLAYAQCAVQGIELKPDANYSVYLPPGRHYASWNINGTALVLDGSGRAVVALSGRGDGFLSSAGASYILRSEGPGLIEMLSCVGFPRVIKAGGESAAPVGLADYGLLYADGDWLPYFYRTDAVLGCFSLSGVDAVSYAPLGPAQAFSIQLNAYVEAGGGLYWAQAIVQ